MTEPAWDVARMRALLSQWDEFVRDKRGITSNRWSAEITRSGSVLRPPCSEEQVRAAERRLGVTLPPSYRSFLLVSNGAYANSLGANVAGQDPHGYLPVEQVDWMTAAKPDWVAAWCMEDWPDDDHERPEPGKSYEVTAFPRARHGLLISQEWELFFDMLVPAPSGDEWELWTTYEGGVVGFRSFADQLRYQMRPRPHVVPAAEQVEDWAESAAQGDVGTLYDLANLDGARAAAVAVIVLNDAQQRWFARANAATVLGLLTEAGTVNALTDLRSDRIPPDASLTPILLEARVYAGDDTALPELRRLAAGQSTDLPAQVAREALARCAPES